VTFRFRPVLLYFCVKITQHVATKYISEQIKTLNFSIFWLCVRQNNKIFRIDGNIDDFFKTGGLKEYARIVLFFKRDLYRSPQKH